LLLVRRWRSLKALVAAVLALEVQAERALAQGQAREVPAPALLVPAAVLEAVTQQPARRVAVRVQAPQEVP
jgi:hypothetical protein